MYRVYYHPTGQIAGFDTGVPVEIAGEMIERPPMREDVPFIISEAEPDRKKMVVDVHALMVRDMTFEEARTLNAPTRDDLRLARMQELQSTDWREGQPEWATYRQALRDITKAGDAAEMLAAWPLRPDGSDSISHLSETNQAGEVK